MKIKRTHIFLGLSAIGFLLLVKFCSIGDLGLEEHKQDIKELHDDRDSLYNVADNLLQDILKKEFEYNYSIDSLNQLIDNGSLSQDEQIKLRREIEDTKKLIKKEKERLENLPGNIKRKDSVVYNIIRKDSVVYNITYKDTVILRKTFVKSEVDLPKINNKPPNHSTPVKSSGGGDKEKRRGKKF